MSLARLLYVLDSTPIFYLVCERQQTMLTVCAESAPDVYVGTISVD